MKRSKGIHVFKKPSFSKKKEKDFKIKEKPKDEKHKEEKHKEDKHKEKKSKDLTAADVVKQWKEKKKKKKPIQETEIPQVDVPSHRPVFGIPLSDAVDRTMMYDGIRLPAVFRECIDYVEKYGMKCEGIYRVSGTLGTLTYRFLRSLPAIFLLSLPIRYTGFSSINYPKNNQVAKVKQTCRSEVPEKIGNVLLGNWYLVLLNGSKTTTVLAFCHRMVAKNMLVWLTCILFLLL